MKKKNRLFWISDYFDNNPLIKAVRQGMVMMMPVLIGSAVALMLSSLPFAGYQEFLEKLWNGRISAFLELVQNASEGSLAIGLALTTCYSYAMQRNRSRGEAVTVMLTAVVSLIGFSGISQGNVSVEALGSHNTFAALFIALGCSVLFYKIKDTRFFRIHWRGAGADVCYAEAVSGVIPALLVVAFFVMLRQVSVAVFHVDSLQEILEIIIRKLLDPTPNGLYAAIVMLLLVHGMWFVGIHGNYVLGSVIYEKFGVISGDVVYNKTFQDVFVCMGGTGSVLCLVIVILLFSAGSVLQAVCLVAGVLIYLPFLRLFEEQKERQMVRDVKELTEELQRQEETNAIMPLTGRRDVLGGTAKVLAEDLKDAVRDKKLFFQYQPQTNTEGNCIGAEALIRWRHPVAGLIYPPLIIQLAKEEKLLHDIETYMFDEAVHTISEIEKEIHTEFKISVNITNESLLWEELESCIANSIGKYHVAPGRLWLEITEQDALISSREVLDKMRRLKEQGHKFLIDDFGMGHTSLLYLQTNYFSVVKLDGALTKDVLENERNQDIIAAITELGKSLHFETIAEYVETKEQKDLLAALGCNAFQGYYCSRPIPAAELILWMKQHRGR